MCSLLDIIRAGVVNEPASVVIFMDLVALPASLRSS